MDSWQSEDGKIKIYNDDCLNHLETIPDNHINLILTDPPYGTTKCRWDSVIPFKPLWKQLERIIKPSGAIVMTACQPFTSALILSNPDMFKYSLVWRKSRISHFAQAPYRFLTEHEDIVVFSNAGVSKQAKPRMIFNPQGLKDCSIACNGKGHSEHRPSNKTQDKYIQTKTGYPKSILDFKSDSARLHPTQKPIDLMEYLILTYTDDVGIVLDFAMGSGTTGIASYNLGRNFIGIEKEPKYFEICKKRLESEHERINYGPCKF